ncbi:phosphatases II [Mycena belliarum]|uniref:phosphatidylinositol-3,4,5-trisphosphate 3-phosphatase n=1 Tax=Mycena belliarum TaxID=1033014 RepID=A0AAD6XFQ6_9AGAR|nr:phosphatases II [Mycena belliae]
MTDYIRRLVSGNKARFKDSALNLELDLVYVTDRVIIMGFPAEGFESFYRNNRADAKRFLEHRHGANFWVFNFCPMSENSYSSAFFDGRVSRYPFPDHHAPPLAILPLAAREMTQWLDGAPERVIVLHCKAGKGRSGTLACTYLLSLVQPTLGGSQEGARDLAEEVMQAVEEEEGAEQPALPTLTESPAAPEPPAADAPKPPPSFTDALNGVLDLHTSKRMKPVAAHEKAKPGVSIPSQRRWLHYWAQLLAHEAPHHLWTVPAPPAAQRPKVRLTRITVRMREAGAVKLNLVRAATAVLDRTSLAKPGAGGGPVWVSLARYDDAFVGLLERWEAHTRDAGGHMGRLRAGAGRLDGAELREVFDERGTWDNTKMVRSFARLGAPEDGGGGVEKSATPEGKMLTYTLRPLTESGWVHLRDEIKEGGDAQQAVENVEVDVPVSAANSIYDVTQSAKERGVVLDAGREVRVKLYMGQVFMCWLWFVPAFHMAPASASAGGGPTTFTLTRKEVDFPLGVGSAIVDVAIEMEWADGEGVQPPARASSAEGTGEPAGTTIIEAVAAGNVRDVVEAKQGAED